MEALHSLTALVDPAAELTDDEVKRYARQLSLEGWGREGQLRLKNASVAVVGVGGLGSPALLYLAAAGVGRLGIIDPDEVSLSNLHRQVLFPHSEQGRAKVESARDALERVNPLVHVVEHRVHLSAEDSLTILGDYDVVLDCTDNFATRYLVNDSCALLGIPLVWASVLAFHGQLSVFWAVHGPCFRCLFPTPPAPGMVPNCVEGGVLGVLPGALGVAMATEALKLITGVGQPMLGIVSVYDALDGSWGRLPVAKDPGCPLCGIYPSIVDLEDYEAFCNPPAAHVAPDRDLHPAELRNWLRERAEGLRDFVLVDVRQPAEQEISVLPDSVLVPEEVLVRGDRVPELEGRLPVLYCRSGMRSARALVALRERGIDAWHLAGGINRWAAEVDPSLPQY